MREAVRRCASTFSQLLRVPPPVPLAALEGDLPPLGPLDPHPSPGPLDSSDTGQGLGVATTHLGSTLTRGRTVAKMRREVQQEPQQQRWDHGQLGAQHVGRGMGRYAGAAAFSPPSSSSSPTGSSPSLWAGG